MMKLRVLEREIMDFKELQMEGKEERVTLKMLVELIRKLDNEQRKKLYYLLLGNELRED